MTKPLPDGDSALSYASSGKSLSGETYTQGFRFEL